MNWAVRTTLRDVFFFHYKPLRLVGRSQRTIGAYDFALQRWERFAGRVDIRDISQKSIAEFQSHLLKKVSPASANCYCRHLMVLLRFAASEECALLSKPPRWLRVPEPRKVPLALTLGEFCKVLEAAKHWPRPIGGIPGQDWWSALLLLAWETGLRYRALLLIRSIDVLLDQASVYAQGDTQKNRVAKWYRLPPYTMEAIARIHDPSRELLFPRTVRIEQVGRWMRQILDLSGIYAPKGCGMAFHRFRRSKASYTKAAGGDAQKELQHSTPAVTERYYDPRITSVDPPIFMPSPIAAV